MTRAACAPGTPSRPRAEAPGSSARRAAPDAGRGPGTPRPCRRGPRAAPARSRRSSRPGRSCDLLPPDPFLETRSLTQSSMRWQHRPQPRDRPTSNDTVQPAPGRTLDPRWFQEGYHLRVPCMRRRSRECRRPDVIPPPCRHHDPSSLVSRLDRPWRRPTRGCRSSCPSTTKWRFSRRSSGVWRPFSTARATPGRPSSSTTAVVMTPTALCLEIGRRRWSVSDRSALAQLRRPDCAHGGTRASRRGRRRDHGW